MDLGHCEKRVQGGDCDATNPAAPPAIHSMLRCNCGTPATGTVTRVLLDPVLSPQKTRGHEACDKPQEPQPSTPF